MQEAGFLYPKGKIDFQFTYLDLARVHQAHLTKLTKNYQNVT